MKNKKFSRILDVKEKEKHEKERDLKINRAALKAEKEKLKSLQSELSSMTNIIDEEIVTSNMELYYKYLHTIVNKIENKENDIKKISDIVNEKEQELLNVYKETKVLNIINEGVLKEEMKKMILNEQKNLDFDYISRKLKR